MLNQLKFTQYINMTSVLKYICLREGNCKISIYYIKITDHLKVRFLN